MASVSDSTSSVSVSGHWHTAITTGVSEMSGVSNRSNDSSVSHSHTGKDGNKGLHSE